VGARSLAIHMCMQVTAGSLPPHTYTRHAALQHRRGSLSDRCSRSPEQEAAYDRSNPPTLPRRTHGGPPAFKPIPPPAEGDQKALGECSAKSLLKYLCTEPVQTVPWQLLLLLLLTFHLYFHTMGAMSSTLKINCVSSVSHYLQ